MFDATISLRVIRWLWAGLLGTSVVVGVGRLSAQQPALDAARPSDAIIAEWTSAGAVFGWSSLDSGGEWSFESEPDVDHVLPAFQFSRFSAARIASVTPPDVPFGLWLSGDVNDEHLKVLTSFTNLQAINFPSNYSYGVSDNGLKVLARIKGLKWLNLRNTGQSDAGLKELAALPNLEMLILGRVTGQGLHKLTGLKRLRRLVLSQSMVDNLEGLSGVNQLQILDLWQTPVTDGALRGLTELTHLQSLTAANIELDGPLGPTSGCQERCLDSFRNSEWVPWT